MVMACRIPREPMAVSRIRPRAPPAHARPSACSRGSVRWSSQRARKQGAPLAPHAGVTIKPPLIEHPHIRATSIVDNVPRSLRDGDLVPIFNVEGAKLGDGFWNSTAHPPLRVVHYGNANFGEAELLDSIRRAVHLRTRTLNLPAVTSAFRVINSDGDLLSGLTVDKFNETLVIILQNLGLVSRIDKIVQLLHSLLKTKYVIFRLASHEQAEGEGIDISKLKSSNIRTTEIVEHGIRYEVNFEEGHKSGFFCDQRENRRKFASLVKKNSSVLDLCSYTGGFALNSKINGNAAHVIAVDGDEDVVKVAKHNGALNDVKIEWVCDDVFRYARTMKKRRRFFDNVVLDPPKLIQSRETEENGRERYQSMNRAALDIVSDGGLFVTCSCSGRLSEVEFEKLVSAAASEAGVRLQFFDKTSAGPDHPVMDNCPQSRYLKVLWARVFRN